MKLPSRWSFARWSLAALFVAAMTAPSFAQRTAPRTIGLEEIRPGMRGYGLSVFRGTTPERFDVEVIDVLHGFRPGQSLILIRTPHPLLNQTRAVGGMSGSPIFLDGRLAGAYAYGWPYGLEPLAGVTPISNMLAELYRPVRPGAFPSLLPLPGRRAPAVPTPTTSSRSRRSSRTARARRPSARRVALQFPTPGHDTHVLPSAVSALRAHRSREEGGAGLAGGAAPATTPIMTSGLDPAVLRLLSDELGPLGLMPVQAGGGGAGRGDDPGGFVDGGPIAVALASGDIDMSGIGTVTLVGDHGRVSAFGHPMLNQGEVGLPTATARILHVLASAQRSFKIGERIGLHGTLVHDRQSSIVIDTRLEAHTVPIHVEVRGAPGAPQTEWNVNVASHRVLTPLLALATSMNAIKATVSDVTDVVATVESTVRIQGRAPQTYVDTVTSRSGMASPLALASLRAFAAIEAVYGNPFEESRVDGLDLTIDLDFRRDTRTIVAARMPRTVVEAGETTYVDVTLRRYGESDVTVRVPFTVPAAAEGTTMKLRVAPARSLPFEYPRPRSLDDLLEIVASRPPSTSLGVSIGLPSRGLAFRDHLASDLPPSALDALSTSSAATAGRPYAAHRDFLHPTDHLVSGAAELELTVRAPRRP